MAFKDYSTNPASNLHIGDGIFIGPNMARDDVREALQQIAADGRGVYDFSNGLVKTVEARAEALIGPTYASTAEGLAATSDGQGFAVDNGDGTVTVYLNSAGSAAQQRTLATTAYLASTSGAGLVGFIQSGTGATARTVQSKARDLVSPLDFGATGDNTADDSAEIAAAALAHPDRIFTGAGKTYRFATGTAVPAGLKLIDGKIEHADSVNTQDDFSVVAWGFNALQANTFVPEQESSTYPAPITNWAHGNHIVAIGGEALKANTTGRRQTAVGSRALLQNTSGYYNTALGSHAMEKNTTGSNNVAVGVQANQEATTASDGVFIGNAAGLSVNGSKAVVIGRQAAQLNASTANMITCVGYRAGYSVTTADDIVCIGRDSGLNATTAARSTFVGANAGKNVTTQVEGTYIGWNAGQVASSAYNTIVGAYAGFALTTGAGATFMGRRAGYAVTTGLDIVAIGQDALVSHTTGNNTVGIGRNAGVYNTTGSNNTYLGHSATSASGSPALSNVTCLGYQATATESNQVVLGNSSVANTVIQGVIRAPKTYVVTSLPSAATAGAGARTFVTDATVTTFASVAAGGGTNAVPVYSDGTSWRIG